MLNRTALQRLSRLRRIEANTLLKSRRYEGAYYLLGYSVECALKACIAKQTNRYDFPDKNLVVRTHTHDLEKLLGLAGLDTPLTAEFATNSTLELNWAVVKDWSEQIRYETTVDETLAKDFYSACTGRKHGILTWIVRRW